jgi:hypothetical protein
MRCSIFWVDRLEKIPNTTSTKILEPQLSAKIPSTPWNPAVGGNAVRGRPVDSVPRHVPVRNDGIKHPFAHEAQRFISIPRKMDFMLCLFEQPCQQLPVCSRHLPQQEFFCLGYP